MRRVEQVTEDEPVRTVPTGLQFGEGQAGGRRRHDGILGEGGLTGFGMAVPLGGGSGGGVPAIALGGGAFHPRPVGVEDQAVEVMHAVLGQP